MEWRCAQCGEIQDEDDPPCDNCGYHGFERAPDAEEARQPTEPVWVCPECGRQHQKNSPPCNRCGNVHLEKRQPDYAAIDEIGSTSYWDVLEARYVAGFLLAGVLGTVLLLGVLGVITIPGTGPPEPPDAPEGDAGGLDLSAVEAAYVAELNDRRTDVGVGELSTDGGLDRPATYYNKRVVEATYGDADPPSEEEMREFDIDCGDAGAFLPYAVTPDRDLSEYGDRELAAELLDEVENQDRLTASEQSRIGVDVHVAPDGRVFVTVVPC